jgi:hypothetical protein
MIRTAAAASAIRRTRRHDAGRLIPIADQLSSRNRIENQSECGKNDHFVRDNVKNVVTNYDENAEQEFQRAEHA